MRHDASALFLLFVWFIGSSESSAAVEDRQSDSRQLSWKELQKRAGYFSDGGIWKGGLPKSQRSTSRREYTCVETHSQAGYCLQWSGGVTQDSGLATNGEWCNCTLNKDTFCQEWRCRPNQRPEDCSHLSLPCTEDRDASITNCVCDRGPTKGNPHCHEWHCTRFGIYGIEQREQHKCSEDSVSQAYCPQWIGDGSSDSEVKSVLCNCVRRKSMHCASWMCEERSILRCEIHFPAWCNLGVAVGLYGTLCLGFLVVLRGVLYRFCETWDAQQRVFLCFIGFGVFVAPWFVPIALVGGFRALGWVILTGSILLALPPLFVSFVSANVRDRLFFC